MEIGRKVYYEKATGNVILITSEMSGDVVETTQDQDFQFYTALQGRVADTVGVISLGFGEKADSFSRMSGVSVQNGELMFTFPDPTQPAGVTTPSPSLEDRLASVEAAITTLMGV